jgi:hypothetical protein
MRLARKFGPFPEPTLRQMLRRLIFSLDFLHNEMGLVHTGLFNDPHFFPEN